GVRHRDRRLVTGLQRRVDARAEVALPALVSGQQQVLDVGERLGKLRGDVDEAVGFHVFQDAVESSALVRVRAGGHGLTYLPSLTYREYVPRVCRAPRRGHGR